MSLLQKIFDDIITIGIVGGFILFVISAILSQMKGGKITLKDCFIWLKEKMSYEEEMK